MDISASTALVTGANRGFGQALAAELVSRGARVYAGARDPASVSLPGAIPVALDITDPASVAAAAEAAAGVTLLVNNAGVGTGASLLGGDLEKLRLEMDTHFFGTLAVTRAFAPKIAANGGGTVLNVLSALSWVSFPGVGGYCAAKSAEWSLTNALRQELAPRGIRVSGLHVGYMDTDLTARVTAPKLDVRDVAVTAVDGIAAGAYEILADEASEKIQAGLAGGVTALYPSLPEPGGWHGVCDYPADQPAGLAGEPGQRPLPDRGGHRRGRGEVGLPAAARGLLRDLPVRRPRRAGGDQPAGRGGPPPRTGRGRAAGPGAGPAHPDAVPADREGRGVLPGPGRADGMGQPLGPPGAAGVRHRDCGGAVRAELRCAGGHQVAAGDLDLVVTETHGPAGSGS